jgi:renalase
MFDCCDGVIMKARIAIIGAGLSGLCLARALHAHADVRVFEKSRGVGGRMSTRYAPPFYFDHGTQYLTARTPSFKAFLRPFIDQGVVRDWRGRAVVMQNGQEVSELAWDEPHWVASPHMNSLCKALADGLNITLSVEVAPLTERVHNQWLLRDKDQHDLGSFDWVISTAPAAQTLRLLGPALPAHTPLHDARMHGCYALMIGLNQSWDRDWIAAQVVDHPIGWIGINSSKPARDKAHTAIVVHASNEWSERHIDDDVGDVQRVLIGQWEALTGISLAHAAYLTTHRWRYALVAAPQTAGYYLDAQQHIASSGDWATASRIEDVWLNAQGLAQALGQLL